MDNIVNIGQYRVVTSEETDGFGYMTVKDAISCFKYFSNGRTFDTALEWCCGPGYFGIACLDQKLVNQISFSDISEYAQQVMSETIRHNNIRSDFYLSDNFKNIPSQKFDLIVGNPPHFNFTAPAWKQDGTVTKHENRKMQDVDWEIHRDFFNNVNDYLNVDGKIMLMENVTGSSPETFLTMLEKNNLEITNFSNSVLHPDIVYYLEISKVHP